MQSAWYIVPEPGAQEDVKKMQVITIIFLLLIIIIITMCSSTLLCAYIFIYV